MGVMREPGTSRGAVLLLTALLVACGVPDERVPPPPPAPAAPTGLTVTGTSWDRLVLTWTPPPDPVDAYMIQNLAGGSFEVDGTCITIRHALPGTKYCYRVSARAKGTWSEMTEPACATTMPSPVVWGKQIATAGSDVVDALAVTPGGEILLARHCDTPGEPSVAFLEKYDGEGSQVWQRELATSTGHAVAIGADGSGAVYVAGTDESNLLPVLTKLGADGEERWKITVGTASPTISVAGLAVDGGGNAFAVGAAPMFVVAFDAEGRKQWERTNLGGKDVGAGIALAASGEVFVVGTREALVRNSPGTNWLVAKLDPHGNLLWTQQGGPTSDVDPWGTFGTSYGGSAVAADPYGAIHVATYAPPLPCWGGINDPPCPDLPWRVLMVFDGAGNGSYEAGGVDGTSIVADASGVYALAQGRLVRVRSNGFFDLEVPLWAMGNPIALAQDRAGDLYFAGGSAAATGASDLFLGKVSLSVAEYVAPSPTCP